MLALTGAWPCVLATPELSVVPVTPPVTGTVPLAGTAGASVGSVSRSRPCAREMPAASRRAASKGRLRIGASRRSGMGAASRSLPPTSTRRSPDPLTQAGRSDISPLPMGRSYFIHTFGCQMNESDSQRMGEALSRAGWSAAGAAEAADLVLINTCSIREKAEDKLFSALGRYRLLKSQRGLKIGVAGCVASSQTERLLARAPFVDFVLGPDHLDKVPELADRGGVETDFLDTEQYLFPQADPETSRGRATAFVTAMKGCDNVCSFCVVPYTLGRAVSRPDAEIVREIASLVAVGVREVTLIGQNVN